MIEIKKGEQYWFGTSVGVTKHIWNYLDWQRFFLNSGCVFRLEKQAQKKHRELKELLNNIRSNNES